MKSHVNHYEKVVIFLEEILNPSLAKAGKQDLMIEIMAETTKLFTKLGIKKGRKKNKAKQIEELTELLKKQFDTK